MSYREQIWEILDAVDGDITLAAEKIWGEDSELILYVISVGLDHIKSKRRALRRRELRRELSPSYTKNPNGNMGFSDKTKAKLFTMTKQLFGADGWQIGDIWLENMTKEELLIEAEKERRSALGHTRNAMMYEALAEPLKPGQKVSAVWTEAAARKLKDKIWGDKEPPTTRP